VFPELVEFNPTKILGEYVSGILGSFNKVKVHFLWLDSVVDKVVVQVNMFDVLFLYWVRGKEYWALIIAVKWDGWEMCS
jgi:hypothetical protein